MKNAKLIFVTLLFAMIATSQTFTNQIFCYRPAEWKNLDIGSGTGFFCTVSRETAPATADLIWILAAGKAFPVPFQPDTNNAGFPEVTGSEVTGMCLPGKFLLSPPANGCVDKIAAVHFGAVATPATPAKPSLIKRLLNKIKP